MKAVGLFSGGLDSALAIKLVQEQGIDVLALNFVSPFCTCIRKGCSIADLAKRLKVPVKLMNKGQDYLRIVRNPKHGYGKGMNPCIDCKIYILKKAKQYARKIGAKFIFTGEVLGQRPMSQLYRHLMLIEKEAGLKGKLVRPLCAGLMPETEAEKKRWIDRDKLLKFKGRRRSSQLDLAKKFEIDGFMCGGGGCRLTDKAYSNKVRDLFNHKKRVNYDDVRILNYGRHFRVNNSKIIVGRNKEENSRLLKLKRKSDYMLEVPGCGSPITILQGKDIKFAACLTATYSDCGDNKVLVKYGKNKLDKEIIVEQISKEKAKGYLIN
jgi:tRNA U34 2-thiouridine synthase MnmA/TrmU